MDWPGWLSAWVGGDRPEYYRKCLENQLAWGDVSSVPIVVLLALSSSQSGNVGYSREDMLKALNRRRAKKGLSPMSMEEAYATRQDAK